MFKENIHRRDAEYARFFYFKLFSLRPQRLCGAISGI
jgi:hypothetical protein